MYARAWWGIVAPAGTPADVIEKLNAGLNRVIRDPQFQEKRMLPQGSTRPAPARPLSPNSSAKTQSDGPR
jgi:tripartite-type tricarboxylate transporter receptor subunit TctC